ncbi:MAG: GNAT family N-acetyltransferase [Cyanobacteria bacterium P01_G01_bin.39]
MQITQATMAQVEDIAMLFNQYRMFYRQPSNLPQAKKFIQERLNLQDAIIFLATLDDKSVGYTLLFASWSSVSMKRVWILNDLFVLPHYRNHEIATALMNAAYNLALKTNACQIILATEVSNTIGQNLYESLGYRQSDKFYHYTLNIEH